MKHLVTLSLLAAALTVAACERADDLDVAVAPVVQGAPIDSGSLVDSGVANTELEPLVGAGHGRVTEPPAVAPDTTGPEMAAPDVTTPEAAGDETKGDEPEGDEPEGDEPEGDEPEGDEPEGDGPDGDGPDGDEAIGDTDDGGDPPLVEDAPADPDVALPELKDGVWYTTFDYLGSFDSGMMAIAEDSVMAQHAEKSETTGKKGIPRAVQKMDRQIVELEGYMIPLKFEKGNVRTFYLSRYMMSCCFGMLPKANEVVEVEMTNDDGAMYDAYMPIIVKGMFEVHPEGADSEYLKTVFTMKGQDYRFSDEW